MSRSRRGSGCPSSCPRPPSRTGRGRRSARRTPRAAARCPRRSAARGTATRCPRAGATRPSRAAARHAAPATLRIAAPGWRRTSCPCARTPCRRGRRGVGLHVGDEEARVLDAQLGGLRARGSMKFAAASTPTASPSGPRCAAIRGGVPEAAADVEHPPPRQRRKSLSAASPCAPSPVVTMRAELDEAVEEGPSHASIASAFSPLPQRVSAVLIVPG